MKPKHTNPINDALNHLDEETVLECMNTDLTPRVRTASHGTIRRVAVAAACLTLTLAVGAAAILPLMRADRPAGSDTADGQTTPINGNGTSLSGDLSGDLSNDKDEVPFVRVQLLSFSEGTEGESGQNTTVDVSESNNLLRTNQLVLRFNCTEGETVTLLSGIAPSSPSKTEELKELSEALTKLEGLNPDDDGYFSLARKVHILQHTLSSTTQGYWIFEVDDTTYIWQIPQSRPNYDIVDFIIRNADGEITGAGSVCIGMNYPGMHTPLIRSTVLGCERYETPASEEDVTAYLDGLRATAEDAYAAMDFTPQTEGEGYALAFYNADQSWRTETPREMDGSFYAGPAYAFKWYVVTLAGQPEEIHRYILFSDGTFCEVAAEGAVAYDDIIHNLVEVDWDKPIDDFSDIALPLTDGRTLTFEAQTYTDGDSTRTKWVAVIDEGQATV